ncbi:MAG: shikimate dehydrogenase [Chitinophagaceae bacterium]|nr:shikimate dehydrogenase [Chitinophagaceae bacterium]
MRKFGLIGYPLSHSFSKKYFTEKFESESIRDCIYELYPLQSVDELPRLLETEKLEGLNITIPYKKVVLPFLTSLSREVTAIQACNCIAIKHNQLIGYNTDIVGFRKTFEKHLQPHHTKALILGTGGGSLAVAYTLQQLNIEFLFVSRSSGLNKTISYGEVKESILKEFTIIINTTPLGTYPDVHQCPPIAYERLTTQHYLYDLVYNPAKTLFLTRGQEQGATIENGTEMLIIQAEESWKIWNK